MDDNKEKNKSLIFIVLIIALVALIAICFIFFKDNNNNNDNMENNTSSPNIYQGATDMVEGTVDIVDDNARMLYDRVKQGFSVAGKVIEVPADYLKRFTDKVTAKGYKMTVDTKNAIDKKLDEIEDTLKSEGKTDINELSQASQDKIKGIVNDIENML